MKSYNLHIVEYPKSAPKIVLLHGLGGTHRYWSTGLEKLTQHYHVILVDLLGFGDSDKPWTNYTKERHIHALRELLKRFDRFVLVGHSLGAALSITYKARFPQQITGLVLISLPFFQSEEKAYQWMRRTPSGWLWTNMLTTIITCLITRRVIGKLLPYFLKQYPPEIVEDLLKHTFLSSTTSLWHVLYNSTLPSDIQEIADNANTVCIHSFDDDAAPYKTVLSLSERNPQWKLITVDGSGHHPWLWSNRICTDAVINLMNESFPNQSV